MPQPVFSNHTRGRRLPAIGSPSAILVLIVLWLLFACGLPLYQLREARREARQDLLRVLASDKPNAGSLIAAFDRSNQGLDNTASSVCLFLAFTSIFLVNQTLRLRRRCSALLHDLSTHSRQ